MKTLIKIFYPLWSLYKFLVLRTLFEIINTWSVWKFRNRRSVALQKKNPLPLNEVQKKILDDLLRDGVSIVHIDDLFPQSPWLTILTDHANSLRAQSFRNKTKTYWTEMWPMENFLLDFKNPFLRFALESNILAIANAYMGMYTRFQSIALSEAAPVAPGTPAIQSQQWHRDGGNKKYVKVFLYLNDVGVEDGPYIYVRGSQPFGKWGHIFPQVNPFTAVDGRIPNEDILKAVPKQDIIECAGRAGTLIFTDTVGLHKGSYSTRNPRFAAISTFISDVSLERRKHREQFRYPDDFDQGAKKLSPQARFAVARRRNHLAETGL